jgi:hypothetical protein
LHPLPIDLHFKIVVASVEKLVEYHVDILALSLNLLHLQDLTKGLIYVGDLKVFGESSSSDLGHVKEVLNEIC